MQKITREALIEKASALLSEGKVNRVLGWKKGEFSYDLTPAVFTDIEQMKKEFVFDDFSGANFSKYLTKETKKGDGKVLVFLKPCDSYSFNQLLTEHRFDREKVYAVGVPCEGMIDASKIKKSVNDAIVSIESKGEEVIVKTLYGEGKTLKFKDLLLEKCVNCKSKKHVAFDELLGEDGEVLESREQYNVEDVMIDGIGIVLPQTSMDMYEHLCIKLILNSISTTVMARMGRITGNWMTCLAMANKKLVDRSARIVSDVCGVSYETALTENYYSKLLIEEDKNSRSPVQETIQRLGYMT